MKKVFIVRLTDEERLELESLIRKGKAAAIRLTRARILLKTDQGDKGDAWTDAEVAEAVDVSPKTVFNIRRRWVEEGLEAALNRKKQDRPSRIRKRPYIEIAITAAPSRSIQWCQRGWNRCWK